MAAHVGHSWYQQIYKFAVKRRVIFMVRAGKWLCKASADIHMSRELELSSDVCMHT